jgi:[acyl-carrier-protein] S-malonyltransferase
MPAFSSPAERTLLVTLTGRDRPGLTSHIFAALEPYPVEVLDIEQVTARVRWRESALYMKDQGVDLLVEIGTGKVLTGMVRRIDRELKGISIETPEDVEAFLGEL